MTSKERVTEIIQILPEELVRELAHYAEYLEEKAQREEWSEMSLAHLAVRYTEDEVEYTLADLKQ